METAKRKNIFNIQEDYLRIIWELEESGGELTPEIEELMKINKEELEDKMKAYHHIIQLCESDNEAINKEIERLSDIKTTKEKTVLRLRETMLSTLLLMGNDNYNKKTGKINKNLKYDTLSMWTTNLDTIVIEDEDNFNDSNYITFNVKDRFTKEQIDKINKAIEMQIITEKHISKKKIKESIESGKIVEGVELITKTHITIR